MALSLRDETGTFHLSFYGSDNGRALGFKGDRAFRNRCYNWAHNCRATKGELHHFYEESGNFDYVCIPDVETLMRALTLQFAGEIKLAKEVPLPQDSWDEENGAIIEYDEVAIEALARQRAESFFAERIVLENFMSRAITSSAPIYGVGGQRDDDGSSD